MNSCGGGDAGNGSDGDTRRARRRRRRCGVAPFCPLSTLPTARRLRLLGVLLRPVHAAPPRTVGLPVLRTDCGTTRHRPLAPPLPPTSAPIDSTAATSVHPTLYYDVLSEPWDKRSNDRRTRAAEPLPTPSHHPSHSNPTIITVAHDRAVWPLKVAGAPAAAAAPAPPSTRITLSSTGRLRRCDVFPQPAHATSLATEARSGGNTRARALVTPPPSAPLPSYPTALPRYAQSLAIRPPPAIWSLENHGAHATRGARG